MRIQVKVCCIGSREEAHAAIYAGADALGLVAAMPSGTGMIDDALFASIAAAVPPPASSVLLTSGATAEAIADHVRRTFLHAVQVVAPAAAVRLAELIPDTRRVQTVYV